MRFRDSASFVLETPIQSEMDIQEILVCFYQTRKPNYQFSGERHLNYELTYVDQGVLYTEVDHQNYELHAKDIMIYYPNQFHAQSTDKDHFCSYLTLSFFLNGTLAQDLKNKVFSSSKEMQETLKEFVSLIQKDQYMNKEFSLVLLKKILILLCQSEHKKETPDIDKETKDPYLNKILDYIHSHIETNIRIEDLCEHFSISRSTLQVMFKEQLNEAPKEYISKLKLERAKERLQTKKYTVSEVAYQLGFSSVYYFSRKFKNTYGISPSEYMDSIRK